jgi:hypothetical protein
MAWPPRSHRADLVCRSPLPRYAPQGGGRGAWLRPVVPQYTPPALQRFNPAPGWPVPPIGWVPDSGWQPDPSWPPAPPGWQFWISDEDTPVGERTTRTISQDVKIAVAARDGGRCRQCGSNEELHFDHVIPWSKGGANTITNIQLLCGPCNRRKGADDIPARL